MIVVAVTFPTRWQSVSKCAGVAVWRGAHRIQITLCSHLGLCIHDFVDDGTTLDV